jgi:hypothetical protein
VAVALREAAINGVLGAIKPRCPHC